MKKTDTVYLNGNVSTTRLLTKEKPTVEQKPEYKLEPKLFLPRNPERKGEGGLRTAGLFKKSYESKPLISIVTVVYNGEKHLEQTINSVLDQNYDNVEYIVIDGGSIDGTLEIVKKYEEQIDYWVSEPDSGIYDAMNKGAGLCGGEYVAFLNADDWYEYHTLATVAFAADESSPGYIFGNMGLYEEEKFLATRVPDLKSYKRGTPIGHQSLFVKVKLMMQMPFDTKYKIASDYDLMIKLIEKNIPYVYIDKTLSNFRLFGVSSDKNIDKIYNEYFFIHLDHFGLQYALYFFISNTKNPHIRFFANCILSIKYSLKNKKIIWFKN